MKTLLLSGALLWAGAAAAQIGTANEDRFASLRGRTLHVQLADTTSANGSKLAKAIRSAWTLGPVSFHHFFSGYAQQHPDDLFATFDRSWRSIEFVRDWAGGGSRTNTVSNDYFFVHFWQPSGKGDEKRTFARTELFYKDIGTGTISFTANELGGLGPSFSNGLPGYLKNYFQAVNAALANGTTINLKKDMSAQPGLAALRTDTLYVPNYWYGASGTMLPEEGDGSRTARYINAMIAEYRFPVRLVRRDELSDLILNTRKPIYYVNYVQSSADKMISVVNGLTGEVLYTNFTAKSYRPKDKDFRDLNKQVAEAK